MIRTPLMNVMTAAALKAGRGLKRDFSERPSLTVERKGIGDFVSNADKKAEKVLFEELSRARPGYGFVMEESGSVEGADKSHTWHIDPLDGTSNFLHGLPQFAISVALEREGQLVAGLVYNPATEEMFVAEKGQGAFVLGPAARDNMRLRVAPERDLVDAMVCCGIPNAGRGKIPEFLHEMAQVLPRVGGVRRLGAAALDLAFVAAGKFDAFWERRLSTWDMAAGIVLIREAGGRVSDLMNGERMMETGDILAGSPAAHAAMLPLLKP